MRFWSAWLRLLQHLPVDYRSFDRKLLKPSANAHPAQPSATVDGSGTALPTANGSRWEPTNLFLTAAL